MGQQLRYLDSDSEGTIAVLNVRQPFPSLQPPDRKGFEFAGAEVKRCFTKITPGPPMHVRWEPWTMSYADGTVAEPPSSWSSDWFSVPLYPRDRAILQGRCARGWIPFEAPKGRKPTIVMYAPDGGREPVEWEVR